MYICEYTYIYIYVLIREDVNVFAMRYSTAQAYLFRNAFPRAGGRMVVVGNASDVACWHGAIVSVESLPF